jgi:hypothetical protein
MKKCTFSSAPESKHTDLGFLFMQPALGTTS